MAARGRPPPKRQPPPEGQTRGGGNEARGDATRRQGSTARRQPALLSLAASLADLIERGAGHLGDDDLDLLRAELHRADKAAEDELSRRVDPEAWDG